MEAEVVVEVEEVVEEEVGLVLEVQVPSHLGQADLQ